eukprot:7070134-Pyramimonas_sp.AAC.1
MRQIYCASRWRNGQDIASKRDSTLPTRQHARYIERRGAILRHALHRRGAARARRFGGWLRLFLLAPHLQEAASPLLTASRHATSYQGGSRLCCHRWKQTDRARCLATMSLAPIPLLVGKCSPADCSGESERSHCNA